jgi:hypothetical protein
MGQPNSKPIQPNIFLRPALAGGDEAKGVTMRDIDAASDQIGDS